MNYLDLKEGKRRFTLDSSKGEAGEQTIYTYKENGRGGGYENAITSYDDNSLSDWLDAMLNKVVTALRAQGKDYVRDLIAKLDDVKSDVLSGKKPKKAKASK